MILLIKNNLYLREKMYSVRLKTHMLYVLNLKKKNNYGQLCKKKLIGWSKQTVFIIHTHMFFTPFHVTPISDEPQGI